MSPVSLSGLQVIPMRYRGANSVQGDDQVLDAFAADRVYATAGVPVFVTEVTFPEHRRSGDRPRDLGALNGEIAAQASAGLRAGRGILMVGGNCTHVTGIVGGLQDAFGPGVRAGLVWFDAHGDFNTPQTTITGSLGGMPVAVCAGLAFPEWREGSHIVAPLPSDRIVMVDIRNLDPAEEDLIRAVGIPTVPVAPAGPNSPLQRVVDNLAERCDLLYLHVDADVLDAAYVPGHATPEPNGPQMDDVLAALDRVFATGKVLAFAVVSIYFGGPDVERCIQTGSELITSGLAAWRRHGRPELPQGRF